MPPLFRRESLLSRAGAKAPAAKAAASRRTPKRTRCLGQGKRFIAVEAKAARRVKPEMLKGCAASAPAGSGRVRPGIGTANRTSHRVIPSRYDCRRDGPQPFATCRNSLARSRATRRRWGLESRSPPLSRSGRARAQRGAPRCRCRDTSGAATKRPGLFLVSVRRGEVVSLLGWTGYRARVQEERAWSNEGFGAGRHRARSSCCS